MRHINLAMSKSTILDFDDDIRDILVSNPAVADAVVRTNRRLYILGNKYGETNIYVYGANNHQIADIELQIQPDVSTLEALLRRVQPRSDIHVEAVTGAVLLTGTVATPIDANEANSIATKFLGSSAPAGAAGAAAAAPGSTSGGSDSVQVINGLKIRGKDQVMLRVTVAEVQRTAVKSLGIDLTQAVTSGNFVTAIASTNPFSVNGTTASGNNTTLGWKSGNSAVNGTVRAFEQDGLLRVLAEPTLTAISGEEATFLVGGEYRAGVHPGGSVGRPHQPEDLDRSLRADLAGRLLARQWRRHGNLAVDLGPAGPPGDVDGGNVLGLHHGHGRADE